MGHGARPLGRWAGITRLDYKAPPALVEPRFVAIADAVRRHWPEIGRVALLHRSGSLGVGEVAVVIAVSTPHRREAFDATSWCIDTVKATAPIWKYEVWDGGEGWGTCAHELVELDALKPTGTGGGLDISPMTRSGHRHAEGVDDPIGRR